MSRDEVRISVARALERAGERGMTKAEIVSAIGISKTSLQTVQRTLKELRSENYEAQIACFGRDRRWRLTAPLLMPLEAPDREDLLAVLIAQAILDPLADAELRERISRLVEDLDERVRMREPEALRQDLPHRSSVSATLTLGTRVDAGMLRSLLSACRRKVLRIEYESPWKPATDARRPYVIEPWALRVHDGAVYLRAWRRDAAEARTFRVAQIEEIAETRDKPSERVPLPSEVWGDENPAFGIDHDRPGTAVVRLRGPVARWVARVVWHPAERNEWIEAGELLERTVAYRSCREMARRLASVIDAVESIEPAELREEVEALVSISAHGPTTTKRPGLDDLRGIMQRVRPGAETQPGAESEGPSRAAEPGSGTWDDDRSTR